MLAFTAPSVVQISVPPRPQRPTGAKGSPSLWPRSRHRSVRGRGRASALGVRAEAPAPRAYVRRPTRHRSLAAPLAVACEPGKPPRRGHADEARRRGRRRPPPACSGVNKRVPPDGATALCGAKRRQSRGRREPTERDREKEAASAAGGAAGAFLYRLDSKTGGEPRSLTHEVAARAAARCVSPRSPLTHSPHSILYSEERSPDEAEKMDDAGKVEIADGGRRQILLGSGAGEEDEGIQFTFSSGDKKQE